MIDLPDAPWIRDAETNGMPEAEPFCCPVCGEECPEYFYVDCGEIVGCSECLERVDAADYADEHPEQVRW